MLLQSYLSSGGRPASPERWERERTDPERAAEGDPSAALLLADTPPLGRFSGRTGNFLRLWIVFHIKTACAAQRERAVMGTQGRANTKTWKIYPVKEISSSSCSGHRQMQAGTRCSAFVRGELFMVCS